MSNFKREVRYTVVKHNQLTDAQIGFLKNCIHGEGIPTVEAVVIESDWPEYEPVWKMIEDRLTDAPVEGGKAEYDAMAKAMTKHKTVTMSRELIEVVEAYMSSQADAFPLISLPRGLRSDGLDQVSRELRNALTSPVVERQPDPVYQTCNGVDGWIDVDRVRFTACQLEPEEYECRVLYTSPPAPVAAESAPMQRFLRLIDYHGCAPDTEAREKVIARAALRAGILPGLVWFHYHVNRGMDLDYQEFLKDLNQYLGDAWDYERSRLGKVKELNNGQV